MQAVKVDEEDVTAIDRLCQEESYLNFPFYACPACRNGHPHGIVSWPPWVNTILSFVCIGISAISILNGHFWPGVILSIMTFLIAWHVVFPFYRAKKEQAIRRLVHAELDSGLTPQQRRARLVNQMALLALQRFLGPSGYLAVIEAEMDYFLQRAQTMQYRLRTTQAPNQDLQGLLGVMARMRQRRQQIQAFRDHTQSQLRELKSYAEMIELALLQKPNCLFSDGQPAQYAYLLLYGQLKFYEMQTMHALEAAHIPGLAQHCLTNSPPDITGFEQAMDYCLQSLPQRPVALSYPDLAD